VKRVGSPGQEVGRESDIVVDDQHRVLILQTAGEEVFVCQLQGTGPPELSAPSKDGQAIDGQLLPGDCNGVVGTAVIDEYQSELRDGLCNERIKETEPSQRTGCELAR
jgi:hypothetical protein